MGTSTSICPPSLHTTSHPPLAYTQCLLDTTFCGNRWPPLPALLLLVRRTFLLSTATPSLTTLQFPLNSPRKTRSALVRSLLNTPLSTRRVLVCLFSTLASVN